MANFLAIEWDGNEARVAIARKRGREAVIEAAFSIDLEPRDPGQTFTAPSVGARVAAELTARNIGRVETLVAVGRKDIELRTLSVPPAPPEELPDVVRLQALRQFSALGEDWPLDYLPLNAGDEIPTNVLAATLSPEHVKQIRATCEVGGLTPRRMVLRPMAAASLLSRQLPDSAGRCRLLIDMLSDEADLTVLMGERVVFLRTAKLPAYGDDAQNTALINEIRRTMVAAQNQLGGQRVEYFIVCGNPQDHASLVEKLGRELSLPVECFDPFAALALSDECRRSLPDRHGRFAPLLGMLVDEAAGNPHAIDFLNPRRRPAPADRRRILGLAGAAAAVLVAAIGYYGYAQHAWYTSEIEIAKSKRDRLATVVRASNKKIVEVGEVDKFAHSDITWLNEMYRLSDEKHFPNGDDAIVGQLFAAARDVRGTDAPGGTLTVDGLVREASVIHRMETALSDQRHRVIGEGARTDRTDPKYPWKFKETVAVTHPDVELPAKGVPKPPLKAAAPAASKQGGNL